MAASRTACCMAFSRRRWTYLIWPSIFRYMSGML